MALSRRVGIVLICASMLPASTMAQTRKAKHVDMRTHGSVSTTVVTTDAGSAAETALRYIRDQAGEIGLSASDLADVSVTTSVSAHTGTTHVYLRQRYAGIDVHGADINVNVTAEGLVLGGFGNNFVSNLAAAITSHSASLSATEAVQAALRHLALDVTEPLAVTGGDGGPARETVFGEAGIADRPITAKLVYERLESGAVVASWLVEIAEHDGEHWWVLSVDGQSGDVLEKIDLTVHDTWMLGDGGGDDPAPPSSSSDDLLRAPVPIAGVPNSGRFVVYAWPEADPNDGPRRKVTNPADQVASPFGWNDTDGAAGAESTQSVGNNVDAYLDRPNDNVAAPSERVDGGPDLLFDFPLDLTAPHATVQPAAVANLFYWNNLMHDISYRYGFDEASGNFQLNNYGRFVVVPPTNTGAGDPVRAEAQDGSGMNNANFSTGTDGNRPRMQMFLWVPPGGYQLQATTGPIGNYTAVRANFGAFLGDIFVTQPTAQTVLASPANGCAPLVGFPAGSIALVDSGTCSNVVKAQNVQNAGGVGIVVNAGTAPVTLTGTSVTVNIPVLGLATADYTVVRAAVPFTAKMAFLGTPAPLRDGDFDAVVIAHEYTHGISNRLTGGRLNVQCLNNNEQMGEGWSDWIALAFTHDANRPVQRTRGLGPYIRFTGVDGPGIRTTRYSTDMAINPTTYGTIATGTLTIPHGIGYAWATALWEVYWNLIDKHGFNDNVYDPWYTGGNNLAIQLVMDGMKLQPCSPGFVTGRNAILQADELLTGGNNSCALWKGFAKRGLGFSAAQGSSNSVNDGVEAFDFPPACAAVMVAKGNFDGKLATGANVSGYVKVANNGPEDGQDLVWSMHEAQNDCSVPTDVPWLSASVVGDPITPPQGSTRVNTQANLAGAPAGTYTALLCFQSAVGSAQIPVKFRIAQ